MDFDDQIEPLADGVTHLKDYINTEVASKTSLVLSILQMPGYHVRLVSCMAVWLLCLSCAPKSTFNFTRSSNSSSYAYKGQLQNLVLSTPQPQAVLFSERLLADSVAFTTTSPNAEDFYAHAPSQTLPVAARAKLTTDNKAISFIRHTVQVTKLPSGVNEKGVSPSAEKPPIHKLAWLSFIFSLVGLALVFITSQFVGLTILVSFLATVITGGIAISKIKKEPDRFSGKGLAKAAIVIVALMLVAFTALIVALLVAYR